MSAPNKVSESIRRDGMVGMAIWIGLTLLAVLTLVSSARASTDPPRPRSTNGKATLRQKSQALQRKQDWVLLRLQEEHMLQQRQLDSAQQDLRLNLRDARSRVLRPALIWLWP